MNENGSTQTTRADIVTDSAVPDPRTVTETYKSRIANKSSKTPDNRAIRRRSLSMKEVERIISAQTLPDRLPKVAQFAYDIHRYNSFKLVPFSTRLSSQIRRDLAPELEGGRDPDRLRKFDIDSQTMRTITANATLNAFQFQKNYTLPYMRKSLSLGYQTVDVLKKISAGIGSLEKNLLIKLEAIKMNTAAPDSAKTNGFFSEIKTRMRSNTINLIADNFSKVEHVGYDALFKKYASPVIQKVKGKFDSSNPRRSGFNGVLNMAGGGLNSLRHKARNIVDNEDNKTVGAKLRNVFGKTASAALSPAVKLLQKPIIPTSVNRFASSLVKNQVDFLASVQPFEDPRKTSHNLVQDEKGNFFHQIVKNGAESDPIKKLHSSFLERSKQMIDHLAGIEENTSRCCSDRPGPMRSAPKIPRRMKRKSEIKDNVSDVDHTTQTEYIPIDETANALINPIESRIVRSMSNLRKKKRKTPGDSKPSVISRMGSSLKGSLRKFADKYSPEIEKESSHHDEDHKTIRKLIKSTETATDLKNKKKSRLLNIRESIQNGFGKQKPTKIIDPEKGHLANLKPAKDIPRGGRSAGITKDGSSGSGSWLAGLTGALGLGLEGEGLAGVLSSIGSSGLIGGANSRMNKSLAGRVVKGGLKLAGKTAAGVGKVGFNVAKYGATEVLPSAVSNFNKASRFSGSLLKEGAVGAVKKIPGLAKNAAMNTPGALKSVGSMGLSGVKSVASGVGNFAKSGLGASLIVGAGATLADNYFENNTTGWTKRLGQTAAQAAQYGALGFSMGGPWGAAIGAAVGGVIANADLVGQGLNYIGRGIGAGASFIGKTIGTVNHDLRYMMFGPVGLAYGLTQKGSKVRSILDNVRTSLFGSKAVYDKNGNIVKPSEGGIMSAVSEGFTKFFFGSKDADGKYKSGSSILSQIGESLSKTAASIKETLSNAASSAGTMASNAASYVGSGISSAASTIYEAGKGAVEYAGKAIGNIGDALTKILQLEGGSKLVSDTGGLTKYGISKNANPDVDVANLTEAQARDIYMKRYVAPLGLQNFPAGVAFIALDAAVNQGVGFAKNLLAKAGNDPKAMLEIRRQHYQSLAAKNPGKYGKYLKGWMTRLQQVAQYAGSAVGIGSAQAKTPDSNQMPAGKTAPGQSTNTPVKSGSMLMKPQSPGYKPMSSASGGFSAADFNTTTTNDNKKYDPKTSTTDLSKLYKPTDKTPVKGSGFKGVGYALDVFNEASKTAVSLPTNQTKTQVSVPVPTVVNAPKLTAPPAPMMDSIQPAPTRMQKVSENENASGDMAKLIETMSANISALDRNTQAILTAGSKLIPASMSQNPSSSNTGKSDMPAVIAPVVNTPSMHVPQAINDIVMSMKKTMMVQTG